MAIRAATAGELTQLRGDGQASRLYLAIRKPTTVYSAQLDNANLPTTTDMVGQVNYVSGVGTLADVKRGMTVLVGTTAGGRDLGLARIRKSPSAAVLYITEISEINWLAGGTIYLTVVDEVALWAKPLRIVSNVVYMDYDVAYSDQHTNFDPVPVLGPDVVLWRTAATVSVVWNSASGSYDPSGVATISSYSWEAPGASATSGLTTATPSFTYNADGQYKVYCTITLSNGKTFTGSRTVFVYSSTNMPEVNFALTSAPRGSYDDGGWKFEVEMYASADLTAIEDRAKVILFSTDYYQGAEGYIGPVTNATNIVAMGWIDGETIEWDSEKSIVRFTVSGAQEWFKKIPGFAVGLENRQGASSAWTNIKKLTPRLMLWHLLHWRSSATQIMDIDLTSDTRQMSNLDIPQSSLWQQMVACAHAQILADPVVDRLGTLYCHVNLPYVPPGSRSGFPTIMTLEKSDWAGTMVIDRRVVPAVSRVELSGVKILTSQEPKALFSLATGHDFNHYGDPLNLDYLLLSSQSQANTLAGLALGYANRELEFQFELAENNRLIDIAPRGYLALTIGASDTIRGITYSGNIIVREVEYSYDGGAFSVRVKAEQETFATLSVNGDVPSYPSVSPVSPPTTLPPLPDTNPPSGITVSPASAGYAIAHLSGSGHWYTKNFNSDYPNWYRMTDGITSTQYLAAYGLFISAAGYLYFLYYDEVSGGSFYYATSLGGTWTLSPYGSAASVVDNPDGYAYPRSYNFDGFGVNPLLPDNLVVFGSAIYTVGSSRIGYSFAGSSAAIGRTSPQWGYSPLAGAQRKVMLKMGADGSYVMAFWRGTNLLAAVRLSATGVTSGILPYIDIASGQSTLLNQTMVPIDAVLTRSNPPMLSTDNGGSFAACAAVTPYTTNVNTEACAANTDGTKLMVGVTVLDGGLGLRTSTDLGATWATNPNIPNKVSCCYFMGKDTNVAGGVDYFAVCQLGKIQVTADFGTSFADRTGDLAEQAGASFEVVSLRVWNGS